MAEHFSREVPVAHGVYMTPNENGRQYIRAGAFHKPTSVYDPFYSKAVRDLGTESYLGIRKQLITEADVRHLDGVISLLDQQQQVLSMFAPQLSVYASEERLPREIVEPFLIKAAAGYGKLAFAEQLGRLEKLREATGAQVDLLEALKNPDDARIRAVFDTYARLHGAVRTFADEAAYASKQYDINLNKFYGEGRIPDNVVKFDVEPDIIVPKTSVLTQFDQLVSAASRVARDPVFVASVRRGTQEAIDDLGRAAERI